MSEPKYETLTLGQALDAVASGEEVEFRAIGSTLSWYVLAKDSNWTARQSKEYTFRRLIQPKKKLVPFTQETWPIGAWVRYCGNVYPTGSVSQTGMVGKQKVHVIGCGNKFFETLLTTGATLLTIENGRVVGEKPCGLEVEE